MKKVPWEKITQFEGPEESPGFLLWQVSIEWRRKIESVLRTVGLTHPQFVLLASLGWLTRLGGSLSQIELARHCKTDITMTSQVVRTLEKRGYIERRREEGNERSKFLHLTKSGADLIQQSLPLVEAVDDAFFAVLGNDREKYIAIVRRLTQS